MTPFYDIPNIVLTDDYLTDPLLMALAWKRTHSYIRSYNWYADDFELDQSSIFLAKQCKEWAKDIKSPKFSLAALQLVPAPKSSKWEFIESEAEFLTETKCLTWQPESKENLSLRPLAHISIKEQTYFTLLMTCLANLVESKQGDPATKFEEVHEKEIVNYGNRLYCAYSEDGRVAEHNYGSTTIYSQYFIDYRKFLQRPYYFAQQQSSEKLPDDDVYIIELDLKQFFDQIKRKKLTKKIKDLALEQNSHITAKTSKNSAVAKLLTSFEKWEWTSQANDEYIICNGSNSDSELQNAPDGIPQGLVAGGFLANVYLLDFDRKLQDLLGYPIEEAAIKQFEEDNPKFKDLEFPSFKLIDYCRYVDDIRLVISGPKLSSTLSLELIENFINSYFDGLLQDADLGINLNFDKTKVYPYRGKAIGLSSKLNDIQDKTSGPMGPEQVNDLISELETLLVLSINSVPEQAGGNCKINKLADIERNSFDIREDTLRRFAANQLSKQLNEKRHFTARETDDNGNPLPGEWDFLQERIARRLVAVWSRDPALVLLLKKGLELFPSPRVLEPVLEQFEEINSLVATDADESKVKQQQAIARYSLAEIFRHSATVIHRKDSQAIPAHADIRAYFEILQKHAAKIVRVAEDNEENNKTWSFLADQARFLLLVRLDTLLESGIGNAQQDVIFKLAKGFRNITTSLDEQQLAVCILLADQLLDENGPLIRSVNELLEAQSDTKNNIAIIKALSIQKPELAEQLITYGRQLKYNWINDYSVKSISKQLYLSIRPSSKPLDKITTQQSLIQLITRPDNPFANEPMAIKLMISLIEVFKSKNLDTRIIQSIDLAGTQVSFESGYSAIPKYEHFNADLKIGKLIFQESTTEKQDFIADDLVMLSLSLSDEQKALRKIAFVIRASLASSKDITGFGNSLPAKPGYRGLKTSLTKRKIGLYTTPESLAGEGAQVTGWLTTLLTKLLRWPGMRVNEQGYQWPEKLDFKAVKKLLEERLKYLKESYCKLSNMPVLPELITPAWNKKENLTVVMVQSKLPKPGDLVKDLYLNEHQYRTKHRRHVATVAALTLQYIQAQNVENKQQSENKYQADLIVWPELAVHQDDLDVLVQLSQKTHAIIFAGLVFMQMPYSAKPINTAIWIVPRQHNGNQNKMLRFQGKQHMMAGERALNIQPWRPYQLMLELRDKEYANKPGFMLTGAICFDATDIKLSADLTDKSNALIIPALNKDVNTFDSMVEALHYHMYQHVVLVNSGEFGGSYAMAPYKEHHDKRIAHNTGKNQVAISSFEMNMFDFRRDGVGGTTRSKMELKTPPAGVNIARVP